MCNESAAQAAYRWRRKRRRRAIAAAQWGILIVLLAAWEILARTGVLDAFLLSCPSRMLESIAALARSGELALHLATTLWETIIGFVLGAVLGVGVAVLLWWSDTLNRILDPYLVILGALPKIALGPVLIVWIGAGMPAIIVMTLLISVIVTTVTALGGFLSVEREKITLLRSFGASKWQTFTMVVFPGALSTTVSALKLGVSMSWIGVIVGEFLVSRAGLGYLIVYGGQVFRMDLVMGSTAVLCVCAALMYLLVAAMEKRLNRARAHGG